MTASAIGQRLGAFRTVAVLGEGGFGVVYRAERVDGAGEMVALKTVRRAGGDTLGGLRREIGALARLRHPGIIRILEHGEIDGVPWYAMELCGGATLRSYLAGISEEPTQAFRSSEATLAGDAPTVEVKHTSSPHWTERLEPQDAPGLRGAPSRAAGPAARLPFDLPFRLGLARRLCAPLAYVHGEGIVHRDLKPENVLLRGGTEPVIVDFGLVEAGAADASRDVLQLGGVIEGTLSYIAPEQARGLVADPRADLYALGCILYELCTGRPPFVAESATALLWRHLTEAPVPPSRVVPGLPAGLDPLVLGLLAKDPAERIGYAEDVAEMLGDLGAGDEERPPAPVPRPRSYLYRSALAGRDAALEQMRAALRRLHAGSGGTLVVAGEAGAGKTRILGEMATMARAEAEVLPGGPAGGSAPAPLEPLRLPLQSIVDRCRDGDDAGLLSLLMLAAPVLVPYAPALRSLPGAATLPPAAELPLEQAKLRIFTTLTSLLHGLAARQPLVLVLDDLQWADELTLELLLHVGSAASRGRLLLVLAHRTGGGPAMLDALHRLPGAERVALARLDRSGTADAVASMLAMHPPPVDLVEHVLRESEGNPMFLAEYLRAAIDAGIVRRSGGRWRLAGAVESGAIALPRSLRALIDARIEALAPDARRALERGAVLGRDVAPALLARLLGSSEAAEVAARELARAGLLEEAPSGELRFSHEKVRKVAHGRLAASERRELHRIAATALEELHASGAPGLLGSLATHWEEAGEEARAASRYLDAAREARGLLASDAAERCFRAFLRLAAGPTQGTILARRELAIVIQGRRGHVDEVLDLHRQALAEARVLADGELESSCVQFVGQALHNRGDLDDAEAHYQAALALAGESAQARGNVIACLARLRRDQGRLLEAAPLADRAVALYRIAGDPNREGEMLANAGIIGLELGELDRARRMFEEAAAVARATGNRVLEAAASSHLGNVDVESGRFESARELLGRALEISRETLDRSMECHVLESLAVLAQRQGRLEECWSLLSAVAATCRELHDRRGAAVNAAHMADVAREMGRLDEARSLATGALRDQEALSDARYLGVTHLVLARIERAAGHRDAAAGLLARAEELLGATGDRQAIGECRLEREAQERGA